MYNFLNLSLRSDINAISLMDFWPEDPKAINLISGMENSIIPNDILLSLSKSALVEVQLAKRYNPIVGMEKLRFEIVRKSDLSVDNVIITNGASEALFLAFLSLLDSQDSILLPIPAFPAYHAFANMLNLNTEVYSVSSDIDEENFSGKIFEKCKVILINSPHNPTGEVFPFELLKRVRLDAAKEGKWVIYDNVYSYINNNQQKVNQLDFIGCSKLNENEIVIGSASKVLGLPDLRIGFLVSKSKTLINRIIKLKTHLSMGCSILSQNLCSKLLNHIADTSSNLKLDYSDFQKRVSLIKDYLNKVDTSIRFSNPEGGVSIMAYCFSDKYSQEKFSSVMFRNNIYGVPGNYFFCDKPSMRFALNASSLEYDKLKL